MDAQFYILGLLMRCGPQHGYRLKQTVEERVADFAQIKLPTIYYHLERLRRNGYVKAVPDKDGNRPEKTVYSITENGEKYFRCLFEKILASDYRPEFSLDGAIYFHERFDSAKFDRALRQAEEKLQNKLKKLQDHQTDSMKMISPAGQKEARAIFSHHLCHMQAELNWIRETRKELSQ